MNTAVSVTLQALPEILAIIQDVLGQGGSASDAQNAVQGHESVRTAHPEIRAAVNTIVKHLVAEHHEAQAAVTQ
jgi:hypothetical protein